MPKRRKEKLEIKDLPPEFAEIVEENSEHTLKTFEKDIKPVKKKKATPTKKKKGPSTFKEVMDHFKIGTLGQSDVFPERKSNIYVIDTSWVAYRSHYVFKKFGVKIFGEEYKTGIMFGLTKLVGTILRRDRDALVFFAVDSKPTLNLERVEDYKKGRDAGRPKVHEYIKFFLPYLCMIPNVYFLKEEGIEADDFLSAVPKFYNKHEADEKFEIFLYTNDFDAYQAIDDNVFVFSTFKKGQPSKEGAKHCEIKWGVSPESMPMLKAIRGKDSDNLPPIMTRFPKELARKLCNLFKTPDELFSKLPAVKAKTGESRVKYIEALEENKDEIYRRFALSKHDQIQIRPKCWYPDWNKLGDFVHVFRMNSMRSLFNYLMPNAGHEDIKKEVKNTITAMKEEPNNE